MHLVATTDNNSVFFVWRENASELTGRIKSINVSADSDARTSGSGDSLSNLSTPVYSCQYPGRNGRPDTCIIRQMFRPYQNHILLQLIPTPKRARTVSLATVILRSMHRLYTKQMMVTLVPTV